MQDCRGNVWELAKEVGISNGSEHSILTDVLSMRRVSAKRGSCIITMHQLIPRNWFELSWPNTTFLWFDRLSTLLTWLLAIFVCSATWKRSWKGLDLSHETTLYGTRRPSSTPFVKRHSRNASNNGGIAERSVFSQKETTSKGIKVVDLQVYKCIFPGQRLDTLWTAHVCHYIPLKMHTRKENKWKRPFISSCFRWRWRLTCRRQLWVFS